MKWWLIAMILAVCALCVLTAYVELTLLEEYKRFFG